MKSNRNLLLWATAVVMSGAMASQRAYGEVEEISTAGMVTLSGHGAPVLHLVWSSAGDLISGDQESTVMLWNAVKGQKLTSSRLTDGEPIRELAVDDQRRSLFVAFNSKVIMGSLSALLMADSPLIVRKSRNDNQTYLHDVAVSPDGKHVAVQVGNDKVEVIAIADRSVVARMSPTGGVTDLEFLPDGRLAVAIRSGGGAHIYLVGQPKPVLVLPFDRPIFNLAASPDGKMLAGFGGNYVQVCEVKEGPLRVDLTSAKKIINDIAWTLDSGMLAVASGAMGLVQMCDPRSGEVRRQLSLGLGKTCSVAFSPDGQWMAVGGGRYYEEALNRGNQDIGDYTVRLFKLSPSIDESYPSPSSNAANPQRIWTSTDGRKIEASLVRQSGNDVVLRMADGKDYNVPMTKLSKADGLYVAELIKKNPAIALRAAADMVVAAETATPQNYRFSVTWSKTQVSEVPKVIYGYEAKVTTWKPKFKVTNSSGRDLTGVTLVYQVQVRRDRKNDRNDYSFETGTVPIPVMKKDQMVEVEGNTFETLTAKLQANYITTDRSRRNKTDDVMGAVVKLIHNAKVVHEYKSGTGVQDKLGDKMRELGLLEAKKP